MTVRAPVWLIKEVHKAKRSHNAEEGQKQGDSWRVLVFPRSAFPPVALIATSVFPEYGDLPDSG